jgi:hypothetical protein
MDERERDREHQKTRKEGKNNYVTEYVLHAVGLRVGAAVLLVDAMQLLELALIDFVHGHILREQNGVSYLGVLGALGALVVGLLRPPPSGSSHLALLYL